MGEAWPWISPIQDNNYETRIENTLDSYWVERRLQSVPERFLSPTTRDRILEMRSQITPATAGGAGLEKIAGAQEGNPDDFWFFDLGCGGWILGLGNLHEFDLLPGDQGSSEATRIIEAWRESPQKALQAANDIIGDQPYEHPTALLYKVPLALWQARDPEAAMTALNRAFPRLSGKALRELGKTVPLTYGLLHGLSENIEQAAQLLDEDNADLRPSGWHGIMSTEVRYHRARYLWALRQPEEATELIEQVLTEDSSYLLRMTTDMAWRQGQGEDETPQVLTIGSEIIDRKRKELTRWQQGRPRGEVEEAPAAGQIDDLLELGDDPYIILSAASLLEDIQAWRRDQMTQPSEVKQDLEKIREFARQVPRDFPFRVGADYAPQFVGPDSDMERISQLVEQDRWDDVADLVARLEFDLPYSIQVALAMYAQRMVNTLASSARVLAARGTKTDYKRVRSLYQLAQQVLQLRDPIRNLPGGVRPELGYQFHKVWEKLEEIRHGWITTIRRAFGQLTIQKPKRIDPIDHNSWRAIPVRVLDASGEPVSGVPVMWQITEGPATPKDPNEFLNVEWALALQTGVARMPVATEREGQRGMIRAWILGQPEQAIEIPFPIGAGTDPITFTGKNQEESPARPQKPSVGPEETTDTEEAAEAKMEEEEEAEEIAEVTEIEQKTEQETEQEISADHEEEKSSPGAAPQPPADELELEPPEESPPA